MPLINPSPARSELYTILKTASAAERSRIGRGVILGAITNRNDRQALYGVCLNVLNEIPSSPPGQRPPQRHGEFVPESAAALAMSASRVQAFGKAIGEATQVRSFVDVGTGPAALLGMLAAAQHPGSEGIVVEINERSAISAERMLELFGLNDRVTAIHDDATTMQLPNVDLGITETFGPVLGAEPGVEIAYRLGQTSRQLIPARVVINAQDDLNSPWQEASRIDLRQSNTQITGQLVSTGPGNRQVVAHAAYYSDRGPILTNPYIFEPIAEAVVLGDVHVPKAGTPISFSYQSGAQLDQQPPVLWAAS